jgi:hypothetical protein
MQRLTFGLVLTLGAGAAYGDAADEAALAAFRAGFAGGCDAELVAPDSLLDPIVRHDLAMPQTGSDPTSVSLWLFPCLMGAYNLTSVAYLKDETWGLRPVAFARPDVEITYVNPDEEEQEVKDIKTIGWTASPFLTNAVFDPAALTMINLSYWRGMGDAAEGGTWQLVDGEFRLTRYEIDASYDGEVNPRLIYPTP